MATDTTPDFLRGFLVPLDLGKENIWTAESTNTEAEERAVDPNPHQSNPMQYKAKGQDTQKFGSPATIG